MSVLLFLMSIGVVNIISAVAIEALRFSVQPIIPENQIEESSWFDLLVDPGELQILSILVTNIADEEIVLIPEIAQGTTTPFGTSVFTPNHAPLDESVLYAATDLLRVPEYLVVPALATATLEIELQMPLDEFDGMIAAGITISEQEGIVEEIDVEGVSLGGNQAGMALENRFRFNIAILIRNNLSGIAPLLNLTSAAAGQSNFRNVIHAYLQNPQPRFLSHVEIHAEVTERHTGAVFVRGAIAEPGAQFAPSSTMQFPIPLNGLPFEAGEYTMRIRAISPDEEWDLAYDFEITAEEAQRLNAEDVTLELDGFPWGMMLIGLALLLFVLVSFLILLLNRKRAAMYDEVAYEDEYDAYEDD